MNILEFMEHDDIMGHTFKGETWEAWRAILSGAFAIPMDSKRLHLFGKLSGNRPPPQERVRELFIIAGRRSAKTHNAAAIASFLGTIGAETLGLLKKLHPGEKGVIALLAVDRRQAKVAMGYITAMFEGSEILKQMVLKSNPDSIELDNSVIIEVATNDFRAIRGRTLLATIFDEVAFFRNENTASPDVELYRAALPGLATTGGMLIGISSPYSRRGLLFDKYKAHYGKPSDVLVIKAKTEWLNPSIDRQFIERALKDDPQAAQAEWLGEFRSDVSGFISYEQVEAVTREEMEELPFNSANSYVGFADPAGGGQDHFTMAIGHTENGNAVIDLVHGKRGTPAEIVKEYAQVFKAYGIQTIKLDRYGGSWPADEFKRHGIDCEHSDKSRSDIYLEARPMIVSQRIELPPHKVLTNQIASLERKAGRNGRDSVNHPPGGHDDFANSALGCAVMLQTQPQSVDYFKVLYS